jgi:hypothetical protein
MDKELLDQLRRGIEKSKELTRKGHELRLRSEELMAESELVLEKVKETRSQKPGTLFGNKRRPTS